MIYEYLTDISKASLAIWLVALLTTATFRYLFTPYLSRKSSFEPVLFFTLVLAGLHVAWEILLGSLFSNQEIKDLVRALWYLGFALSDWALIFAALWAIKRFSLTRHYGTDTILVSYAIMGVLQITRYYDRYILETNALEYVYKNGIPAINTIITFVVVWQSVAICHGLLKSTKEVS